MQNSLIIILSILGLVITSYISISHILKKKVICPINSKSCNIVLDSKYSRTLGIKNEFIGLIYYIIIIIAIIVIPSPSTILATKLISILAAAYSLIILAIQIRIIRNYCSWCISTAIINILIAFLITSI